MDKKFVDAHFHAYNLSHPNLSAFADRFLTKHKEESDKKKTLHERINSLFKFPTRALNVLSIMDNDLGDYFLYINYYLYNSEEEKTFPEITNCQKIVLCPLVVDFGLEEKQFDTKFEQNMFYKLPPQKPVNKQISDLFKGIKFYFENDLKVSSVVKQGKTIYDISHININASGETLEHAKKRKLFEIYPFLGINTQNCELAELKVKLDKFFSKYDSLNTSQEELYQKFYDNMGKFDGNLNQKNYDYNYIFSGIKMYPPLGFDPWPTDQIEKTKVQYLYKFCSEKGIPITTHCSSGGFKTIFNNKKLTNPAKWEQVLQKYSNLKLNLAHMGQDNKNWMKKVINLITDKTYPNVYTDFSDYGHDQKFYRSLKKTMNDNKGSEDRIMFGSDFMINLLDSNSYNEYLKIFFESKLDDKIKNKLYNQNPLKFLFGE